MKRTLLTVVLLLTITYLKHCLGAADPIDDPLDALQKMTSTWAAELLERIEVTSVRVEVKIGQRPARLLHERAQVEQALSRALEKRGFKVAANGDFLVKLDLTRVILDPTGTKPAAIRVELVVIDSRQTPPLKCCTQHNVIEDASLLAQLDQASESVAPPDSALPADQDDVAIQVDAIVEQRIAPALKTARSNAVTLAPIVWDNGTKCETGPGIVQLLADSLTKLQIGVVPASHAVVRGVLTRIPAAESRRPAVRLEMTLTLDGNTVVSVQRMIFGTSAIARIEGLTASLDPKAGWQERVKVIEIARTNLPALARTDATLWCGSDRLFGVALQVGKRNTEKFAPRKPDTRGFIKVDDGEIYIIRLRSTAMFDTAVKVSCAGIDWTHYDKFAIVNDEPPTRLILLPAGGETTLRGWAIAGQKSLPFDVARLPTIASTRQDRVGIVTAEFYSAWKQDETTPSGKQPFVSQRCRLRTWNMNERLADFQIVERQVGNQLRAVVTIRYGP